MATFNMSVRTTVTNHRGEILILKENRPDRKKRWDLPGSELTRDESFDEVISSEVYKQTGFYVYPTKVVGATSYSNRKSKLLTVIMESQIINGELRLSEKYSEYKWIFPEELKKYPLTTWLNHYIKETKEPFCDVQELIDEQQSKKDMRDDMIKEKIISKPKFSGYNDDETRSKNGSKLKNSLGIFKDVLVRTLHPKRANIEKTQPKENIYTENSLTQEKQDIQSENTGREVIMTQFDDSDNITVEHETEVYVDSEELVTDIDDKLVTDIADKIMPDTSYDVFSGEDLQDTVDVYFDDDDDEIRKPIQDKFLDGDFSQEESDEIKKISKNHKIPYIRKEKESKEKLNFISGSIKRNWKDKINELNLTDANKTKKQAPLPKGKKR